MILTLEIYRNKIGLQVILKEEMWTRLKSILIFPVLAGLFCFSMFYRVTNAVIAPDLVREFNLDAEGLGLLGSAFFYTFAVFQIPMGMLLDSVEPRKIISLFSLVGAAGAFVFACAGSFYTALLGRGMLGIGMASVLMGSLKVFAAGYSPHRFSTLAGTLIAIGTLGNFLATSPLVYLNSIIGWRITFICCGFITTFLAILIFFLLKELTADDHEDASQIPSTGQTTGIVKSTKMILLNLSFWQIGSIAFFRYGTFVALQGVWLGPYLMVIKGFTPLAAGNILMMLSLGMIIGSPIAGYLADRVFRKTKSVVLLGLSCYALCLLPLTGIWKIESAFTYSILFMLLGFFSGFGMLAYSHIKELFPLNMSGTVIAGINFFVMAGGAFFIQIIGIIISLYTGTSKVYTAGAYHLAFLVCLIGMIVSLVFYSFSKSRQK
jgi:MFS family permease